MRILVTGGSGFIGSNYIKTIIDDDDVEQVVNVDVLTYAGNLYNNKDYADHPKYKHEDVDIRDEDAVNSVFARHTPTHVVHLAAESHVDNSIAGPKPFIETNIVGTFNLLEAARQQTVEKFHHVSTDEVYGELGRRGFFRETTPYDPRNPYSASKASADMIVRSYFHTFNMPIVITNCCNNYGPRQHREKFIPTIIGSLMRGQKIPVYGDGKNMRDWIHVDDHSTALWTVLKSGVLGETYNIGARCEKTNISVVLEICKAMGVTATDYIAFVKDRPGHDFRYAIDNKKIVTQLGFNPAYTFKVGIKETVLWYKENSEYLLGEHIH